MSQAINIPQIVGGSSAYVGFTGSTGGLSSSQKILTWMYTTQSVPPTFSPTAGTYADPQTVTLSSATSDAAIYYTTDGSQPSGASTQYSGSIQVGESETIQAIAISKTSGSSNVASAAYVIQTPPPASAFSLDATSISIASAGGKGTAVITITPSGGFTGTVALTCAITSQPANAVDPPTCSVSQPQAITGTQAVSATLTVSTTGAATAALNELKQRPFGVGGSILTALALFCIPIPRRKWQTMIGLLFAAILIASASGCGSSNSTHDPSSTATTSGTYVVTVTGTSGSQVATKAIAVTVQ
jgi:hypothetical protein